MPDLGHHLAVQERPVGSPPAAGHRPLRRPQPAPDRRRPLHQPRALLSQQRHLRPDHEPGLLRHHAGPHGRLPAQEALRLIERHGCTSTFGFDAHWQGMRRVPDFERYRFSITKAILAGEPRTYDLVRAMCPPGATINNLYAQTENGPLVSLADHDCVDEDINKYTHGRPLPGVQVVIKDIETGARPPQGQPGEICYKSPYLFRGYHAQSDETAKAFDDEGYFHSGDYGHLDNGYVTYLGRLGGVVKSGGENVSTAGDHPGAGHLRRYRRRCENPRRRRSLLGAPRWSASSA
ncbi:MAG: AMP-binding protein [Burkholderiaceae bacterium]